MNASGALVGFTASAVDITDRRLAEEQLRLMKETLEQQVAERTAVAERRSHQLRRLAAELTQTEQRERKRLAEFLHDELQQLMIAAKMRLATVQARVTEPELREPLAHVDELIGQSIETSRTLTSELSPSVLHETGLPEGLQWLARWMEQKHGLIVDVQADGTR